MALDIELWVGRSPVSGVSEWWDDIEAALAADATRYPVLASVDPYDPDAVLSRREVTELARELARLRDEVDGRTRRLVDRLLVLCETATAAPGQMELRLRGD